MSLDKLDWLASGFFIFIQFIGSGYVSVDRDEYEKGSAKINCAPPGWLFGPAWIILKLLRGFAGVIFWHEGDVTFGTFAWAMALYFVNIIFDIQWMPLFFGQKRALIALLVLIIIWLRIL